MKTLTLAIAIILASTLSAGPALSGGAGTKDLAAHFARLDQNGDGLVSRAEFLAPRPKMLARLDGNGDGVVTRGEFGAAMAKRSGGKRWERIFDRVDRNGDGRITAAERADALDLRFTRLDGNGDGAIDHTEFAKRHRGS